MKTLYDVELSPTLISSVIDAVDRGSRRRGVFDGLAGFAEAIHTSYPQTKVQLCVAHLVRAARLRYVSDQDSQAVAP